jgi:histone acetyltransferase (RNA polymerase elongator complex component)
MPPEKRWIFSKKGLDMDHASLAGIQKHDAGSRRPTTANRPFIIPIFIPHAGCPHQCIFCNQKSITGTKKKFVDRNQLRNQVIKFLSYKKHNRKPVQIAFFGGNFLGLESDKIIFLLEEAADFVNQGLVDGIRFSTRPDTIDERRLSMIEGYPVATIELGVQSMDDRILALAGRGHSASDTVRAVERLKRRQYTIALQMMVGLPGDDKTRAMTTARKVAALQPDFVRIYPTVVVENSRLADWYENGNYMPPTLEESVTLAKTIYLLFKRKNIEVIRMGLQSSEDLDEGSTLIAGPYHPAFGHLVHSEIFLDKATAAIIAAKPTQDALTISVNPRSISKMRGLHNSNIEKLKDNFRLNSIQVVPDPSIGEDQLIIS